MTADVIKILSHYGESVVTQIRNNLRTTKTDATGKTAKSLGYKVHEDGSKIVLTVFGKKYFTVVETGRVATKGQKPSKQFVANIAEWIKVRGIDASPYAIARSINEHGSKLKQKGGRKDIFSNVINHSLIEQIGKSILDLKSKELVTNIKHIYGNSSK